MIVTLIILYCISPLRAETPIQLQGTIQYHTALSDDTSQLGFIAILGQESDKRLLTEEYCKATKDCSFSFLLTNSTRGSYSLTINHIRPEISGNLVVCGGHTDFQRNAQLSTKNCIAPDILRNLNPSSESEGGLQLGITTWYMGESNYRDMIEGKTVQVFLPLPREDTGNYYIPVFGFAYYKGNGECFFRREGSDSNVEIEREDKLAGGDLHVLRYDIHGMPSSSGIYVFNCAASGNTTKQIKIHLVMVQDKSIIFPDDMTFYKGQDSPVINATVISTTKLGTFLFIKVNDHKPTGVEVSETKASPVAYQFKIRFPSPEEGFKGRYTFAIPSINVYHTFQLNILKKDTESPPQTINPQEEVQSSPSTKGDRYIKVRPRDRFVERGKDAFFDCTVSGLSNARTVQWIKESETDLPRASTVELVPTSDNTIKLRLHLATTDYTNSGTYHCICCEPNFQYNHSAALLIFPPGIINATYTGNVGDEAYNLTNNSNDDWSMMLHGSMAWAVNHVYLVVAGSVCLLTTAIIVLVVSCALCQKCSGGSSNELASSKHKTKKKKYSRLHSNSTHGDKQEEAELMIEHAAVGEDSEPIYSTSFINEPPPPPPLPARPAPTPSPPPVPKPSPSRPVPVPSPPPVPGVIPMSPPPSRPAPPILDPSPTPKPSNSPIPKPPPIPSHWKL